MRELQLERENFLNVMLLGWTWRLYLCIWIVGFLAYEQHTVFTIIEKFATVYVIGDN